MVKAKRTPKAPKAARATPAGTEFAAPTEPQQTAKLTAQIKRLEFLKRLTEKAQETFAPTAAASVYNPLVTALENISKALDEAKLLPATFRFGTPGKPGMLVGDTVTLGEKNSPKYGGVITGNLTIKEIAGVMILVETSDAKLAWIPRGHITK